MRVTEKLYRKGSNIHSYRPVTMAFLGDSVTQGCFELIKGYNKDIDGICDYEAVYPNQLKKMINYILPEAPLNIINAGNGGGNVMQAVQRLDRDVLAYSPDLVVICFGLNDVGGGVDKVDVYGEALRKLFIELKTKEIDIIFMTPNMLNTYVSPQLDVQLHSQIAKGTAELQNNGTMDTYMECARRVCAEEGIILCDCYSKWKKLQSIGVDTTKLLSNHINHPTREMHKLFAQSLFDQIIFGEENI